MTRNEVIAGTAAVVVIVAVVLVAMNSGQRNNRVRVRDAVQLKQVATATLAAAAASKNGGLLPGAIARIRGPGDAPGHGQVDETRNDHASLYSSLIAQGLISPALLVSAGERNPNVTVCHDYDFNSYHPEQGTFWDERSFKLDLQTGCNASFAATPLDPTPRRDASIGYRGPKPGMLPMMGNRSSWGAGPSAWEGVIAFQDLHVDWLTTPSFVLRGSLATDSPAGASPVDHLFRNDTFGLATGNPLRNSDAFLVMQKEAAPAGEYIVESSPQLTWD